MTSTELEFKFGGYPRIFDGFRVGTLNLRLFGDSSVMKVILGPVIEGHDTHNRFL